MAWTVYDFQITVPAGTPQSAGWSAPMTIPPATVQAIEWRVPPGPRGVMGFAIGTPGMAVIPHQLGTFIVADDQDQHWDLDNLLDSGGWELFAYNTGNYDHTVYVRFLTIPVQVTQAQPVPAPIDSSALSSSGSNGGITTAPPPLPGVDLPPIPPPPVTGPAPVSPPPSTPPTQPGQLPSGDATQQTYPKAREYEMVTVIPIPGQVVSLYVAPTGEEIFATHPIGNPSQEGRWVIGTNCQYPQAPGAYFDSASNQVFTYVLTNDGNCWQVIFNLTNQQTSTKQV